MSAPTLRVTNQTPRAAFALSLAIACLAATPLQSQSADSRPHGRGWQFGIDPVAYASLTSDTITRGRAVGGSGLSIRFGWGFSERLSLVSDVSTTVLKVSGTENYFLSHGDILLRWNLVKPSSSPGELVPFVHGGFGVRSISAIGDGPSGTAIYEFTGEVLTVGGGASFRASPRLSFFAAGYWSTGDFNDERAGNVTTHSRGEGGVSSRISIGLSFHRARRN